MTQIITVKGNIVQYPSDVIVNAANTSLLGGSGIDGAIHKAAGKKLLFACMKLGGAKTGQAKMTDAYNITTAQKIIHTVGPVYKGIGPEKAAPLLEQCYRNSLDLAKEYTSITFPGISTGIYGYPLKDATEIAVKTIQAWLKENKDTSLETITLIAFTDEEYETMDEVINDKF